ncbi:replication initiator protein A [Sphingobium yanoikuyae]|uniref:replication initiator protein A n=1 Tax=Sphingobium yanoikuyae TaxID=13690 RepID=UPI000B30DD4D|nr:replication initiator protein A [Sphingobium yanoikuyae]
MKPLAYSTPTVSIEVRPSARGVATIYDKEIVLYIASLMAAKMEAGMSISQDFTFTAHNLFSVTGANHSARSYSRLADALERLQGTEHGGVGSSLGQFAAGKTLKRCEVPSRQPQRDQALPQRIPGHALRCLAGAQK